MTTQPFDPSRGAIDDLEAARRIAATIGSIAAIRPGGALAALRWTARNAESVDVYAEMDGTRLGRMIIRGFALVAGEPVGGSFLVDDNGFRFVDDLSELLHIVASSDRWVALPAHAIAAMPRGALLELQATAPNIAIAVAALHQSAA